MAEVKRMIVAVDDSPAALAAVGVAIALAAQTGARLRFVHVIGDGELVRALSAGRPETHLRERRARSAETLLRHVVHRAGDEGVEADAFTRAGEPARVILGEVSTWGADLVVIGRSDVRGTGRPYVGAVTRHVLEFCEKPALVVPRPD